MRAGRSALATYDIMARETTTLSLRGVHFARGGRRCTPNPQVRETGIPPAPPDPRAKDNQCASHSTRGQQLAAAALDDARGMPSCVSSTAEDWRDFGRMSLAPPSNGIRPKPKSQAFSLPSMKQGGNYPASSGCDSGPGLLDPRVSAPRCRRESRPGTTLTRLAGGRRWRIRASVCGSGSRVCA